MWIKRLVSAPRVNSRRQFVVALCGIIGAFILLPALLAIPAHAETSQWSDDGSSFVFNGHTYTRAPSRAPQISGYTAYQWVDRESTPNRAHLIYFLDDTDPKTQTEATQVTYKFEPPSSYTDASSRQTVNTSANTAAEESTGTETNCDGSIFAGLGWMLCPFSNFIADGTDRMYGLVRDFLETPAITADPQTGIYELWSVIRTFANVAFVIAFIIIIYSQMTGLGISNHSIKSMLPRLIIGAIFVNFSFWLSAIAIDISNILGHSVYAIFDNIRNNMTLNVHVDWSGLTTFILSGGAIVGSLGFIAAAGGSLVGLGFLLISALASVAFGIFVAFVILAARQALLTVLLLLSPLAFVAYILPGTQPLFDRWRKSFTTLLLFFPLFALLFGGSAVAGIAIMNNANGLLHIVIIGLAVQTVPLIITPFLIQFSTGLLGRIAGLANTKNGLVDRTKNWARENAEYQKTKAVGDPRRTLSPWKAAARATNRASLRRDNRRKGYEASAQARARGRYDRKTGQWRSRASWEDSDRFRRQSEAVLAEAESLDTSKFKDLQAGHYTYTKQQAPRALNRFMKGRYQELLDEGYEKRATEAQDVALRTALNGTRTAMAERKQHENYAQSIADTSIMVDGVNIQTYAAGVMGQTGLNSVAASAKTTVSEADMKDAKNIQATMSHELQTSSQLLKQAFLDATTMTERLAYANQMAVNGGPGFKALRETITEWEERGQSPVDLEDMKELLSTNSTIMSGGKDLETWITNDGGKKRKFEVITDDISTWGNLSAKAFAGMNQVSQAHALNLMKRKDTALYNDYRRTLLEDPTSLSSMKITVRREHGLFLPGEPTASDETPPV